jgi:hypothetical protein
MTGDPRRARGRWRPKQAGETTAAKYGAVRAYLGGAGVMARSERRSGGSTTLANRKGQTVTRHPRHDEGSLSPRATTRSLSDRPPAGTAPPPAARTRR